MELKQPKILFFDIESIGVNALKADLGRVVCFGYKWQGQKEAHVVTMTKSELKHFDDKPLLEKISKLYIEAELTVAHYGSVFDRRFLQGRLLINNLPPWPMTKMRDTCMIFRSVANFSSNRLKYLCKILKLGNQKLDNNWPDAWFEVMRGNMKALKEMAIYCRGDVMALEDLYNRVRPFDNAHTRMYNKGRCRVCGSDKLQYRGFAYMGEQKYRRYQCTSCSKWDRERKAYAD